MHKVAHTPSWGSIVVRRVVFSNGKPMSGIDGEARPRCKRRFQSERTIVGHAVAHEYFGPSGHLSSIRLPRHSSVQGDLPSARDCT